MKCIHCEYQDNYDEDVKGSSQHGGFYKLPIKVERINGGYESDSSNKVYACPACCKLFMLDVF